MGVMLVPRRSGCVVAAVLLSFSICVSSASAGATPNRFPARSRALPPTVDLSLIALRPGTDITGYLGPESLDPLAGYPPSGYDTTGFTRLDLPYAGIIQETRRDGVLLHTYCLDLQHEVWGNMAYRFATWREAHVPNLGYIERVLHDYFPNKAQPSGLTAEQKAAAVQAAIWFFSDRYVLTSDSPLFDATSAIVTQVLSEGPLPEPELPSLTITGPVRIHAGVISGPFTVHTTAAKAAASITGGEMFEDAAGRRPIPNGTELRNGDAFYVRSAEPGKLKLSATASVFNPAGEVALYVRDAERQPDFPEQGQKIILAADARMKVDATKIVEVSQAPPTHKPSISVRKWVSPRAYSRAGQLLHFRYEVTNTGNVTLSHVRVDDSMPGLSAVRCTRTTHWRRGTRCTAPRRTASRRWTC